MTLQKLEYQKTAFCIFFGLIWGAIFKRLLVGINVKWIILVVVMLFTGIVGTYGLVWVYKNVYPEFVLGLTASKYTSVQLLGYLFPVGVSEELVKVLPLLLMMFVLKQKLSVADSVLIGLFSGLGFAAFENMHYADSIAGLAAQVPSRSGQDEKLAGIQMAMYMMTLRSLSLVFSHAIWTGIASYFIAFSAANGRSFLIYFLAGMAISVTLHGLYDWMLGIQVTLAAMIIALSFFIFYGYLRVLNSTPPIQEPPPVDSVTIEPKQV